MRPRYLLLLQELAQDAVALLQLVGQLLLLAATAPDHHLLLLFVVVRVLPRGHSFEPAVRPGPLPPTRRRPLPRPPLAAALTSPTGFISPASRALMPPASSLGGVREPLEAPGHA